MRVTYILVVHQFLYREQHSLRCWLGECLAQLDAVYCCISLIFYWHGWRFYVFFMLILHKRLILSYASSCGISYGVGRGSIWSLNWVMLTGFGVFFDFVVCYTFLTLFRFWARLALAVLLCTFDGLWIRSIFVWFFFVLSLF